MCPFADPFASVPPAKPSTLKFCLQATALLVTFAARLMYVSIYISWTIFKSLLPFGRRKSGPAASGRPSAVFYEGVVTHVRTQPAQNSFTYPVRVAVIDLDAPPPWFSLAAGGYMNADAARKLTGTSGRVMLLTNPPAAG